MGREWKGAGEMESVNDTKRGIREEALLESRTVEGGRDEEQRT